MKVFNLTDVETPELKQRSLVNMTFAVGPALLAPGDSTEVDEAYIATARDGLQELIAHGAASYGEQPPPAYVRRKANAAPVAEPPAEAPPPAQVRKKG